MTSGMLPYVPLQIQRQPFSLMPRRSANPAGSQPGLDVAIDLDSSNIQTQEGERLFLDEGGPSKFCRTSPRCSRRWWLDRGTLTPSRPAGRAQPDRAGAYRCRVRRSQRGEVGGSLLDRRRCPQALPAAELAELRDRGFLEWLYFQMASVSHVSGLVARKNKLLTGVTAARRPAGA